MNIPLPTQVTPAVVIGEGKRSFIWGLGEEFLFYVQVNSNFFCHALAMIDGKVKIEGPCHPRMVERILNQPRRYIGEIKHHPAEEDDDNDI
jgi:hypothetical protein